MTKEQAKKLRVGQSCLCIDNTRRTSFTVGRVYKVSETRKMTWGLSGDYIDFIDDTGATRGLYNDQLELVDIDTELGKILYL